MDGHGYTKKQNRRGFPIGNKASPNASPDKIKIERIADADITPSTSSSATAIMIDDSD